MREQVSKFGKRAYREFPLHESPQVTYSGVPTLKIVKYLYIYEYFQYIFKNIVFIALIKIFN